MCPCVCRAAVWAQRDQIGRVVATAILHPDNVVQLERQDMAAPGISAHVTSLAQNLVAHDGRDRPPALLDRCPTCHYCRLLRSIVPYQLRCEAPSTGRGG